MQTFYDHFHFKTQGHVKWLKKANTVERPPAYWLLSKHSVDLWHFNYNVTTSMLIGNHLLLIVNKQIKAYKLPKEWQGFG